MLIPQDSYVSVDEADAYHNIRASAERWTSLPTDQKERLLVSASDFLDINYKLKDGLNDKMRSGIADIPQKVKQAIYELSIIPELTQAQTAQQRSVKVGSIAVTYEDSFNKYKSAFNQIGLLLADLLEQKCKRIPLLRA